MQHYIYTVRSFTYVYTFAANFYEKLEKYMLKRYIFIYHSKYASGQAYHDKVKKNRNLSYVIQYPI